MTYRVVLRWLLLVLVLSGCRAAVTRAAIKSDWDQPVTVRLTNQTGSQTVVFDSIPPNATSEFQTVPFDSLEGIQVEIVGQEAPANAVQLKREGDNILTIRPNSAPLLDVKENPDNKAFW